MKTSKRRKLASKANAAKSTGPKTPEGKARSSYNARRHGLLSHVVVLECENRATFEGLLDQFVARFAPLDDVEFGMVEEMASCHWRMRRGWVAETEIMNRTVRKHSDGTKTAEVCIADAVTDLAATHELSLLSRYEGRLSRMYQRALRNLLELRAQKAAEAAQSHVEKEEENAAAKLANENDETNLIPKANTDPAPVLPPQNPQSVALNPMEPASPPDRAKLPPAA